VVTDQPLDSARLRERLTAVGCSWRTTVLASTGSTNADAAQAAREGAAEGLAILADEQTAGRGRLGRSWQTPANRAVMCSVLLRPAVPAAHWGWLTLLAGVALVDAVRAVTGVESQLKWPNDLLIGDRKVAGVLAEVPASGAVVLGIGLNVAQEQAELPVTPSGLPATSLRLAGASVLDRELLAAELLALLQQRYESWHAAGGDPDLSALRADYLDRCATIGRQVRVLLPGEQRLDGVASTVDRDGRLLVTDVGGHATAIAAGDVVHLR
jgi:BirA family transcriptional regulator, biotin operon repressor / biotin---[acetyl-CoA-carboxylase] ligase